MLVPTETLYVVNHEEGTVVVDRSRDRTTIVGELRRSAPGPTAALTVFDGSASGSPSPMPVSWSSSIRETGEVDHSHTARHQQPGRPDGTRGRGVDSLWVAMQGERSVVRVTLPDN